MPTNVRTATFADPTNLIAPDLSVQQQQVARRQALADALRQQSMEQAEAGGGRVSWTQGLAKLAQAWAGRSIQKEVDQKQVGLSRAYAASLRNMFGAQGDASTAAPSDHAQFTNPTARALAGQSPVPAQPAPETPPSAPPAAGGGVSSSPPAIDPPSPAPAAPSGAGPSSPGPWSLSGNPQQDMAAYMLNPEKYGEAVIGKSTPTDTVKNLVAQGFQPGTPAFQQALGAINTKAGYIAPIAARPGGVVLDPVTHQPIFQGAQVPEGYNANYGPDGKAASITPIPGGPQAVQANAAAKAFGGAAGDALQVFNPATGQMEYRPKQAVLQGGAGGGIAAGPALGAQAAYNVTGTNSANVFQTISDGAADAPNRIYALKQMAGIVADPKSVFGPGSDKWNAVRGTLATLSGGEAPSTTNAQEFNKWASQYSARSAQELGLSGSDARVQIAIHATPNGEMTKPALMSVIPQMVGLENAKQGYANAAVAWQQQHGPQSAQQFRTQWNQMYDPQVYTLMAQGPQAFAAAIARMPKAQAAQLRGKYLALKSLGALPR